jgi:hypothetical protein
MPPTASLVEPVERSRIGEHLDAFALTRKATVSAKFVAASNSGNTSVESGLPRNPNETNAVMSGGNVRLVS